MRESKITATERLRRNGDWETASLYRDDQRKRLRSEGMRRREANEESWRLMLEEFPPPDENARSWYMALAEFPPSSIPRDVRGEFTDVWRVYCRLKAYLCFCDPEIARAENSSETTERRLRVEVPAEDDTTECPTERTNQRLVDGFRDPSRFFDQAEVVFRDAVDAVGSETPETLATHDELSAFLDGLPRLRQAAVRHRPTFGAAGLSR